MEVDDDFPFVGQQVRFEELRMEDLEDLEEGTTLVGADDLVEYSAGEDEVPEELMMDIGVAKVEPIEEPLVVPQTVITSPNITVKRVVNSKPVSSGTAILQKVVPKQANLIKVTNAAGKVVLMQKHTTTAPMTSAPAPVKLLNSMRTSPGATTSITTSYHLVKSEDGVVRPKLAAGSQTMIRRVVPAAEAKPKMVVKAPTHVVIHTKSGTSSGTTTKTVTVAEAHQMGLLNNNKVNQVMMPKQTAGGQVVSRSPMKAVASASGTSMVRLKQSPGASTGATQKIIVKANPASTPGQKVVMSQSAIKAGQQSGQIKAINIPGKGIQYVRFLNNPNSGSSPAATNKIVQQKLLQMQVNKAAASAPPGSKIIVQNNKTYVLSNGSVTAVRAAANSSQPQQFRTIPAGSQTIVRKTVVPAARSPVVTTIKKEPESTHYIALVKKEDGTSSETVAALTSAQYGQLKTSTVTLAGGTKTKIVMVPTSVTTAAASSSQQQSNSLVTVKRESVSGSEDETRKGPAVGTIFPDEAYKKRPCNCTKSQCLKLYCDCFANGEFCYNCNCRDCYNNLDNEEERQKAIRATLERNPSAFKPKIGATSAAEDATRRHTKGCNCKRSGCLKNYCECYEAKIACSGNCKCIGCRNTEQYAKEYDYAAGVTEAILDGISPDQSLDHSGLLDGSHNATMVDAAAGTTAGGPSLEYGGGLVGAGEGTSSFALVAGPSAFKRKLEAEPDLTQLPPSKQPYNFMTPDVIEATVQCMIAQADECQKRGCNIRTAERMILEEFGRCLVEIIDFSTKSDS
uniref:Putative metallothionein-like protein n=1 Tax=Culex tarsalis TaxID=7177 RepID=A0A1Q3FFE2_CULTA